MDEEATDEEKLEESLDDLAGAAVLMLQDMSDETLVIESDPKSFKALLAGYLYLYERYRGMDEQETRH